MPAKLTTEVIQMLEHIPNAFYALDKDKKFLFANRRMLEIMRKTEDQILGLCIWDVFPGYLGSPVAEAINAATQSGQPAHSEQFYPSAGRWYEIYAYPSPYGLAVYTNDVTERKRSERHLAVLNNAGMLLATSYDTEDALQRISKLIVPEFADWFTVDFLDGEEVQPLVLAHQDPEKVKWGIDYRSRTSINVLKPKEGSVGWVIRIGVPLLLNDIGEPNLAAAAQDSEHMEVLRQMEIRSVIIVPMPFKGKNMGAVTFISSQHHRQYTEADLNFARDLATRIGISIENARLYEQAKRELAASIRKGNKDSA